MRKIFVILLCIFSFSLLFAVDKTNGTINVKTGDEIKSPVYGKIVQKGNKGLPKCFEKNTIVIEYENVYWYEKQEHRTNYQVIISGVKFSKEIKAASVIGCKGFGIRFLSFWILLFLYFISLHRPVTIIIVCRFRFMLSVCF